MPPPRKPELLAPSGSMEALIAAVGNGADAVYLGGDDFSARQYAANFPREEMVRAIDYAHVRGVRVYVTVNTLVKDAELDRACDYLHFLCNAGADAVIVQDLGLLGLIREQLPELPVHASTQMTVHNAGGAALLRSMGVGRVVLARELSLGEVRRIRDEAGVEVETFIHGALCFSYSGQCLLSSMIGGRSGNRGYCAQPCRKRYRAGGVEGYLLSTRDLNTSGRIGDLIEAGIACFKIEGRMKRPEYVAGVVRIYRALIDRYCEAPGRFRVSVDQANTLLQLFNRGFTTAYYFGNPGSGLMSRGSPHNRGTPLGTVANYDGRKGLVEISLVAPLSVGDGIGFGAREAGVTVREMRSEGRPVREAGPGATVAVPMPAEVKAGEAVFKTGDARLMAALSEKRERRVPVEMEFTARAGEPVRLVMSDGGNRVEASGAVAGTAERRPLTRQAVEDQLNKLGSTPFEARKIVVRMEGPVFIPLAELNSLRREAAAMLERARAERWKRHCVKPAIAGEAAPAGGKSPPLLAVNTGTAECMEAAADGGADVVYIGGEQYGGRPLDGSDIGHAIEYGRKRGAAVFMATPMIMKDYADLRVDTEPDGFLVSNIGALHRLRGRVPVPPLVMDYTLNTFNRLTMKMLLGWGRRVTLSPELTLDEVRALASLGPAECIVHGAFPLMVSEHDLAGNLFPRQRMDGLLLEDEKGFSFPVHSDRHRRTHIFNSRELCMLEHVPELVAAGVACLRIEAKLYDGETAAAVTRAYRAALDVAIAGRPYSPTRNPKSKIQNPKSAFTTGHYFRGVK